TFTQDSSRNWQASDTLISSHENLVNGQNVLMVIEKQELNPNSQNYIYRITGNVARVDDDQFRISWNPVDSKALPKVHQSGAFIEYKGATLTARSFDRILPGLGYWMVPLAVWLFAISTMISWSYYGEQGVVYLFGTKWVKSYRVIYC